MYPMIFNDPKIFFQKKKDILFIINHKLKYVIFSNLYYYNLKLTCTHFVPQLFFDFSIPHWNS
ncbi:hypothetical protein BpHYR1_034457 [Brachionus plicatilis]|uniref:Uncharacterized protein n=1 Tax=Brachionus plicatilis TaxID=10195 RepID=A0A3M7SCD3_BRAPC|nr:hypothetical protein BpHYR1_034457 [Brachionus plicatilis]